MCDCIDGWTDTHPEHGPIYCENCERGLKQGMIRQADEMSYHAETVAWIDGHATADSHFFTKWRRQEVEVYEIAKHKHDRLKELYDAIREMVQPIAV